MSSFSNNSAVDRVDRVRSASVTDALDLTAGCRAMVANIHLTSAFLSAAVVDSTRQRARSSA